MNTERPELKVLKNEVVVQPSISVIPDVVWVLNFFEAEGIAAQRRKISEDDKPYLSLEAVVKKVKEELNWRTNKDAVLALLDDMAGE